MGEIGENAPKPEPIVTKDFLIKTFTDPKFVGNIIVLAHHAHLNLAEGSFIVQTGIAKPIVSGVKKSPRIKSAEDADTSLGTIPNVYENVITIAGRSFVKEEGAKPIPKPGIAMIVHSHPLALREGGSLASVLRPSLADLENWQTLRGETKNPYIVEGIVVPFKGNANLFLYQLDPNSKEDLYWQQYDESEPHERLLRYMRESGIRFGTLVMALKASGFSETELAKLDQFVTT